MLYRQDQAPTLLQSIPQLLTISLHYLGFSSLIFFHAPIFSLHQSLMIQNLKGVIMGTFCKECPKNEFKQFVLLSISLQNIFRD